MPIEATSSAYPPNPRIASAADVQSVYLNLFGAEPNPESVSAMLPAGLDAEATARRIHDIHLLVNWILDDAWADGSLAAAQRKREAQVAKQVDGGDSTGLG